MIANYDIIKQISTPLNGKCVYLGSCKLTQKNVAIKIINYEEQKLNELDLLINEINILKQLKHENIIELIEATVLNNSFKLYLTYPLMSYLNCKQILLAKKEDSFNELSCQLIAFNLLNALDYLHSKLIIHSCICPENVYISLNGNVYLNGFKFSKSLVQHGHLNRRLFNLTTDIKDYLIYLAPEQLQQNLIGYSTKSDIYSLGITICELANGVNPFVGCTKAQVSYYP
jgi:STE20-related kinase adapter protein alpha